MKTTHTRIRAGAIAALASLTLLAAACGDDEADAGTPATEAPAGETMTTEMATDTTDESMSSAPMDESMLSPTGPACASVPADGEGSFEGMADDPAATAASNNPELSTLVAAVSAAGLVDTLNGEGPFTIFAPANSAFAAIPPATLETLLADPTGDLTSILTLHVIAGEQYSSTELAELGSAVTVNGEEITFAAEGDTLMVNGSATVVCADVPTANATVHIIDAVLLPAG